MNKKVSKLGTILFQRYARSWEETSDEKRVFKKLKAKGQQLKGKCYARAYK